MNNKIKVLFFSCWFLASGVCFGAPADNPASAVLLDGRYPTKFTLQAEGVWERKLTSDSNDSDPIFKGAFYTGKVSLYTGNKFDAYILVGVYDGKIRNFINENYIITSKADVAYGGGVSYVFLQRELRGGILRLGADAKYRQFEPDIDSVAYYRQKINTSQSAMDFSEWQASVGAAYQYKFFVPYAGLKYSDMRAQIHFIDNESRVEYSNKTLRSKNKFGLFYGIDILMGDSVSFNIEGRYFDEKAINAGLNCRI